jgi:FKBP-type peptidyl-prolyl cis-trans isomerase FkpA/FKBP-type peptidyl-prolyl cis-trans isomerase FklB
MHTWVKILLAMVIAVTVPALAAEPTAAGKQEGKADSLAAGQPQVAPVPEVKLDTEDQKTIYAIGLSAGDRLQQQFNLSSEELELFKAGVMDGALKRTPQVDLKAYQPKFQQLVQARAVQIAEVEKKASEEFFKKMAKEKGAVKTDSGLIFINKKAGTGASPAATDTVKVDYHGTLRDGTVFDSSVDRGTPATFPLNRVIPCWSEGLQKMKVGGKAKLVCPSSIAYGDTGRLPTIKPGATLVFEVELLETDQGGGASGLPEGHP